MKDLHRNTKKKKNGYIALTTVLIVLPLLLLAGIDLLYKNMSLVSIGKMNYDHNLLEVNAETCLEETVYRIKRDRLFTGVLTLNQDSWSCNSTIADKSGEIGVKLVTIEVKDLKNNKAKLLKELNTNTDPFGISNI